MPLLGVNIDHIATVRQARRTWEPDPLAAAMEAVEGGADCITAHLREDRRHIQDQDLRRIREACPIRFNLEMAATEEMVEIAGRVKPDMCTLVPEGRAEVTTEGGLDVAGQLPRMKEVVARLRGAGIDVSAFIDAQGPQVDAAAEAGFGLCEVHTGPYAHASHANDDRPGHPAVAAELQKVAEAGLRIAQRGMLFNAGHALHYANVAPVAALAGLHELHIGHAIVSRSLFVGMRQAVAEMKSRLVRGRE